MPMRISAIPPVKVNEAFRVHIVKNKNTRYIVTTNKHVASIHYP